MENNKINKLISIILCLIIAIGIAFISSSVNARYPDDFNGSYDDLNCAEDDCDCLEPDSNRFSVVSPSSAINRHNEIIFTGTYEEVLNYFNGNGLTDGLPIVPPTVLKAEKFMRYTPYGDNDVVSYVNGREVTAYQVAANAIMSGSSAEYMPVCIAFAKALGNPDYVESISSGSLTPMMYVSGPIARQIGVDNSQGMTTEECNIAIARFIELALINLAGIRRSNAFGNVQPLVFSENEEVCLGIGWNPSHVEKGYGFNESTITAGSFSMWGNNITPATDIPEEIMKVIAWDITEKNLGGLGGASITDNANTRRVILLTESVASTLADRYKTKGDLESALVENARRPLWMRAYSYYYSDAEQVINGSFESAYLALEQSEKEDASVTQAPPWLSGISYSEIETVATMIKGNTDIVVTGDSSRNKSQVVPGGITVTQIVELPGAWNDLMTSMGYKNLSEFNLTAPNNNTRMPSVVPDVLTDGVYRILNSTTGDAYLNRAGRFYYDQSLSTLYYYSYGAGNKASIRLDESEYEEFIRFVSILGENGSIELTEGRISAVTVRFSTNENKLIKNFLDYSNESFGDITLKLHSNSLANNVNAGGLAKDGATINMSASITSFEISMDGALYAGEKTNAGFVKLIGSTVTVNPNVEAGAKAIIGALNDNGTYRTITFVNNGDASYTITYNTWNTLSNSESVYYLVGSFNDWETTDAFVKTGNGDIVSTNKYLDGGTYQFKVYCAGSNVSYGSETVATAFTNRLPLDSDAECGLVLSSGSYEFKFEISTGRISIYPSKND